VEGEVVPALPDQNEHGPDPSPVAGWRPHTRSLIVFGALVLLVVATFAVVKRAADREASDQRARAADQAVGAVRAQLSATRADVRGIVGVFSTARTIDDFAQFAEPALANPALDAVSWAPRVTAPMRSAFEREHGFTISEQRADGIGTAAERATYYPTTFVAPTSANARAIGLDLSGDPAVADAVKAAIVRGAGQVTAPAQVAAGGAVLLIEPAFQRGAPLATPAERADALTGIAIGTMKPAFLVTEALRGTTNLHIRITDGTTQVYGSAPLPAGGVTRSFDAGGRTWQVAVESTTSPGGQALPWVVLAAGLLAAALFALVAEQSSRRLTFAEDLVARRTVELREALELLNVANAEAVEARADAERKSQVDALTDTYNRLHMIELLKVELNRAERGDATPAVLLVDVDDFRWLNDEYGPTAGDIVLVEIARRLKAMLRSYDSLGRYDNKRFAVLAPNVPSDEALFRVADAIRQVVCTGPVHVEGRELWPTVSVGAARATAPNEPFQLLATADEALAAAHHRGRNTTAIAGDEVADIVRPEPDAVRIAQALAKSAATREGMPEHHNRQVADLSAAVAQALGLDDETVLRVRLAGWLHDVGKVAIPEAILSKPEKLTKAEWKIMRTHAALGQEIVTRIADLAPAGLAVRHHHERYDGSGYPDALIGEKIPLEARIVAAADAFSAMTSDPPFRRSRGTGGAVRELRRSAGTHLDPGVVDALCAVIETGHDGTSPRRAGAART
jgi:diguanylate cyclase (GGDEF)-like protein